MREFVLHSILPCGCVPATSSFSKHYMDRTQPSAILDLNGKTLEEVQHKMKRTSSVRHNLNKATRAGFVVHRFEWKNFLWDIVDVNTSMKERQGQRMGSSYLDQSVEQRRPANTFLPMEVPACPLHHAWSFGVFMPKPGHKQGEFVVDERLVAYIHGRRSGNLAHMSMILGHGEFLHFGIMSLLVYETVPWLLSGSRETQGVEGYWYGHWVSGLTTLQDMKRRLGFEPMFLVQG